MNKFDKLTEENILKVSLLKPESIFYGVNEDELKIIYRKMSALWHPDKHINDGKDTGKVFIHIKDLYESALKKLKDGTLGHGLSIKFISKDGKEFLLKYQKEKEFELGKFYISNENIVWCFLPEYKKEAEDSLLIFKSLKFADEKMKKEFAKYVPKIIKNFETKDYFVLVMQKEKGFLNLKDVQEYYGKIEVKHVAWIMSSMYNLECFLKYNEIMHGGITLDNYYINPENHEGLVLGGWWYSRKLGSKINILSQLAVDVAPISLINSKKAEEGLDLEMIKLAGRTMLGDSTGVYLSKREDIPKRLTSWLRDSSMNNAFKEYAVWMKDVLKESFGVRRFIKMELTVNDIYKGE